MAENKTKPTTASFHQGSSFGYEAQSSHTL
jgi:hypothetical protein